MNLTNSQKKAVERLFAAYKAKESKVISFKAPTGSGKTFMSSNLISYIFEEEKKRGNNKTMVVVATISDAELPKSFASKIEEYKKYLSFNDFEVEFRNSPSNTTAKVESVPGFSLENNKVLIFGTSSFGKNRLFNEQGILDNFLYEAKLQNWNIVYIRDEAHKGAAKDKDTKEKDYESFDKRITDVSSFSIQMTATPNGQYPVYELSEHDLVSDGKYLLKTQAIVNPFEKDVVGMTGVLSEAISKFKTLQEEYKTLNSFNVNIRPAMLIQIDSKRKDQTEKEHEDAIQQILDYINKNTSLNWMLYTSDKKINNCKADISLDEASKSDSIYDVVIFKVGASTGWDIPRAAMLVQLRDVSSETLNIQTIGRIKRNPYPGLHLNSITDRYYIYTDYQEKTRTIEGYSLKEKFKDLKMYFGTLEIHRETIEEEYIKSAIKYFEENQQFIQYSKEFTSQKYLEYITQTLRGDTNIAIINRKINSSLKLKIWALNFEKDNFNIFPPQLVRWMKNYSKQNLVSYEMYLFAIKDEVVKLKDFYNAAYKLNEQRNNYEVTNDAKLMKFYQVWKDNSSKNVVDVSELEFYGYNLVIDIDKENKNLQYLDSFPEAQALREMMVILDNSLIKKYINFFSKMPTLGSKVYFEYFKQQDASVHKSFVDFAIVLNSGRTLMIEVKGFDDYDENKTSEMIEAYSRYMKKDVTNKIQLAVIYAGKENGVEKRPKAIAWDIKQQKYVSCSIADMINTFVLEEHLK